MKIWISHMLSLCFFIVQFLSQIYFSIDFIQMRVTCFSNLLSDTKDDKSILPAFSMKEVDLMPAPFLVSVLHDKISLWGTCLFLHPCKRGQVWLFCFYFLPCRGNFTVPKLSESNMGFGVLGVFLGLLLEVSTHGPHAVPRTSWRHQGKPWCHYTVFLGDLLIDWKMHCLKFWPFIR